MRIGIIGATGKAGRDVFQEAVSRGHETTALVRSADRAAEVLGTDTAVLEKDAFDLTTADLARFDVVVNAFGVAPDQAHQHVELARQLVDRAGEESPRLVFILGAGSLYADEDGHLFVEDLRKAPGSEAWIAIPEQQLRELDYLRTVKGVQWVGASPQAEFVPGEPTTPMIGGDDLLIASDGTSHTTTGTMAVALLDEIEQPRHSNTRFAVGDA